MVEKLLSIVMPAYNEERNIGQALEELKKLNLGKLGFEKEIIVVNDGSTDSTEEILKKMGGIRFISYGQNRGKGYAIRQGFKSAKGSVVVIHDADLEYDAQSIAPLLGELLKGHSVVYGSRFIGRIAGMSFSHFIGNKFLSLATSILFGQRITDMETCQKMMKREVLDSVKLNSCGFCIEPEITASILKKGIRIKEVPIPYKGRAKKFKKINVLDGFKALWILIKIKVS